MGIADVSSSFLWRGMRDDSLAIQCKRFVLQLIEFTMENNYFYLQKTGMAMGVKFAPSLANLFIVRWAEVTIYDHAPPKWIFWMRYIDDVLIFLWRGACYSLKSFIEDLIKMSGTHSSLKYTKEQIHFFRPDHFKGMGIMLLLSSNTPIGMGICLMGVATILHGLKPFQRDNWLQLDATALTLMTFSHNALFSKMLGQRIWRTRTWPSNHKIQNLEHNSLLNQNPSRVSVKNDYQLSFITTFSS